MPFVDKLREEIITSQQSQASLAKWKLLLIAAIGASSLGVLPDSELSIRTTALLALLPLVCLYVDTLCYHSGRRVMTIAKYFRVADRAGARNSDGGAAEIPAVGAYERFCTDNRHHFGLEGVALLAVSVLISAGVALTGAGLWLGLDWLPNPYKGTTSTSDRLPLAVLLIASGIVGILACGGSYKAHRREVDELDDPHAEEVAVKKMIAGMVALNPNPAAQPVVPEPRPNQVL